MTDAPPPASPYEGDGLRGWVWPHPFIAVREARFLFSSCGGLVGLAGVLFAVAWLRHPSPAPGSLLRPSVCLGLAAVLWITSAALGAWRGRVYAQVMSFAAVAWILDRSVARLDRTQAIEPATLIIGLIVIGAVTILALWIGVMLGRSDVRALFEAKGEGS